MKFNSYKTHENNHSVRAHQLTERSLADYLPTQGLIGLTRLHKDSPEPVVGDWLVYYSGEDTVVVLADTYFQANFTLFDGAAYFRTGEHDA